ncbi:MAG: hypothetical protein LQ350_001120, partial [Teloschistes chrysophthalmus]
ENGAHDEDDVDTDDDSSDLPERPYESDSELGLDTVQDEDGDLEMADNDNDNDNDNDHDDNGAPQDAPTTTAQNPTVAPERSGQEATPPDSPPRIAAQIPALTEQAVGSRGGDAMDEGDTVDAEEDKKAAEREEGREEREMEGVEGEKAAEVVLRKEEGEGRPEEIEDDGLEHRPW